MIFFWVSIPSFSLRMSCPVFGNKIYTCRMFSFPSNGFMVCLIRNLCNETCLTSCVCQASKETNGILKIRSSDLFQIIKN